MQSVTNANFGPLIAYLVPLPDRFDPVLLTLMGAAVLATVVTGADYVVRALALRRAAAPAQPTSVR